MANLALAIPYETETGEAVFVRIEVWRLGARLTEKPEVEFLRLLPRFGMPESLTEEEYRDAVAASLEG